MHRLPRGALKKVMVETGAADLLSTQHVELLNFDPPDGGEGI